MRPSLTKLLAYVDRLDAVCPWTAAQRAADMMHYTRKELIEVDDVLREASVKRRVCSPATHVCVPSRAKGACTRTCACAYVCMHVRIRAHAHTQVLWSHTKGSSFAIPPHRCPQCLYHNHVGVRIHTLESPRRG